MCNKKTEAVKVHMSEELFNGIARLAERDDRSMSDYCERVLRLHFFGHGSTVHQDEKKA